MLKSRMEGSALDEEVHELTWPWWMLVVGGVLAIIAGIIVLAKPSNSLATLAVVSGVFILVESIFGLVVALAQRRSGVDAVWGVLGLVFGLLLIRHPFASVTAVAIFVGIWLVSAGALRIVRNFAVRESWWHVALALLELIAGIVIISSPHVGFSALALLVGISFLLDGFGLILVGVLVRSVHGRTSRPARRRRAQERTSRPARKRT